MKNRIIIGLVLLGVLGGQFSLAQTPVVVTGGQVNVTEVNPTTIASILGTAASTGKTFVQQLLEWGHKFILESLRRRLLNMIVDQIVQWIQGGGEPKFVTDWQGLLRDAADQALGDFIKESSLGFLCEPFSLQIQIALQSPGPFSRRAACTLDQIAGNIRSFKNNFENGSWITYTESFQPQNNYYGSLLMAMEEREKRIGAAQIAAQNEALSGDGFLSTYDCEEGTVIGPGGYEISLVEDVDGDGTPGDIKSTCKVTTPGGVIGKIAADAIGSDIPYIINAQELEAYVSAIANAAINRLIKEGVTGLQGMTTSNSPSGGYITSGLSGPCSGLTGAALEACLGYGQNTTNSFDSSRNAIISQVDSTLNPRLDAQRSIESSLSLLQNYQDNLNELYEDLVDLDKKENSPPALCFLSKSQLQNQIAEAINDEDADIANLQQQLTANQVIIDGLTAKKEELNAITDQDWNSLNTLISSITAQLDPVAAEVLKDEVVEENGDIRSRTTQTLNRFRNQVNICYE